MIFADLKNRFNDFASRLSRRERYFVATAGAVILVFIAAQLIVMPIAATKGRLARSLAAEKDVLNEMLALQAEFRQVKNKVAASPGGADRGQAFTLFSFLDNLAGQSGVKDKITYMKPSTAETPDGTRTLSVVEVKLEAVNLKDLAGYLYAIETSDKMVFVQRLSVSRNAGARTGVDAVMQVETVKE